MGRGDVRSAILAVLAEEPMHGYQIIREIEARSNGAWTLVGCTVAPGFEFAHFEMAPEGWAPTDA